MNILPAFRKMAEVCQAKRIINKSLLPGLLTLGVLLSSGCAGVVSSSGTGPQQGPTPLAISISSLPTGTVNSVYSANLTASGGTTPYSWSISSGALSAGLTLSTAGTISGTPTTSGMSSFTLKVADSSSPAQSTTKSLSITVVAAGAPLQITTSSLPGGQVGGAYTVALAASGGKTPYTWTLSVGALPSGLALSSAGVINGKPTASGTTSFTVKVADSSSPAQSATNSLSITVAATAAPVQITSSSLPGGQVGTAYTTTLAANGGTAPYMWSLSVGSLPSGLAVSSAGVISGTPTAPGTSSFTVAVADASSPTQNATKSLSIAVVPQGASNPTMILCPNAGETGNIANCAPSPTLTFGKQGTSTTSGGLTISVNNCSISDIAACTGSGSLILGTPYASISGADVTDFADTGTGSCSSGQVIPSGGSCTIVLTLTPKQPSGTNETATLTVNSNSPGNQTIGLAGTSATVTQISSCQALSGGTNYQLTAGVSSAGTCFTVNGSNTDINLNGFTLSYGNSNNASVVAGVLMNSFNVNNTTVHNGAISEGAGANTGLASGMFGSGAIIASSTGSSSSSSGTAMFNLNISVHAARAKVLWEENSGGGGGLSTVVHDVIYTTNDTSACNNVGCRAEDQGYPIVMDQSISAGPTQFYNNLGIGGTQGGMMTVAGNSAIVNNVIDPGSSAVTNSNGFAYQDWGTAATVENNLIVGIGASSGPDNSCISCRGIQIGAGGHSVNGSLIENNTLYTYNLQNNTEYNGCQIDGTFGMQINIAGEAIDVSNNTLKNNKVYTFSDVCPAFGFSYSSATNNNGPNQMQNNVFSCVLVNGATAGPCAGIRLDGLQYSPHPDNAVINAGDTFVGDTSAIYIFADGTQSWTCNQCTFGKGPNAISGWVLLDYFGGFSANAGSNPIFLVDPVFTGGAAKDSNNLARWSTNNSSLSFSYTIQWTYTVTAKGAVTGSPISGASVAAVDSQGKTECSGTTNSSGVFSCILNDTSYSSAGGRYTTTSSNPFAFTISASSCTTTNYSETILGTTSEVKTLGGC